MGKRQVRIFHPEIEKHLPELVRQKSVQVVLRSKVVLHGSLSALGPGSIQLVDFRFGKHALATADVEEVIYDVEAPY